MNLFGKHFWNKCCRKKAAIRLGVESLEDRLVPAAMITSSASHLAASAALSEKAGLMATMPGQMQIIDRAQAAVHVTAVQDQTSIASKVGLSSDVTSKIQGAASAIANLDKVHATQGDFPEEVDSASQLPPSQYYAFLGQAQQALGRTIEQAGLSPDRLAGESAANSWLNDAVFGSHDQSQDWLDQLPFLSAVQGQDPIQVGALHQSVDPRAAEDGDDSSAPKVVSQSPVENGNVTIKYSDGSAVKVSKDGTVTYHDTDSTTQVTPGKDGDTVVTTSANGMIFTDRPDGVSIIESPPSASNQNVTVLAFDKNDSLIAKGYESPTGYMVFDIPSGEYTVLWHMGEIDEIRIGRPEAGEVNIMDVGSRGRPDHPLTPDPMGGGQGQQSFIVVTDPNYRKILQMPNPEGDGWQNGSGEAPVGAKGVELFVENYHQFTEADVAKLVGRTVVGVQSTVNPNPDALSMLDGAGAPHATGPIGDPPNEYPVHNGNVHPGGKPSIIFGPPAGPKGGI